MVRGNDIMYIFEKGIILAEAVVSFSQSQYFAAESNTSMAGFITLSNETSKDVVVEVTLSDGSAYGNTKCNIIAYVIPYSPTTTSQM